MSNICRKNLKIGRKVFWNLKNLFFTVLGNNKVWKVTKTSVEVDQSNRCPKITTVFAKMMRIQKLCDLQKFFENVFYQQKSQAVFRTHINACIRCSENLLFTCFAPKWAQFDPAVQLWTKIERSSRCFDFLKTRKMSFPRFQKLSLKVWSSEINYLTMHANCFGFCPCTEPRKWCLLENWSLTFPYNPVIIIANIFPYT